MWSNECIKYAASSCGREENALREWEFITLEPPDEYSSDSDVEWLSSDSENEPAENHDLKW